jgi:broad specificity phosphatase PhoE
VFQVNGIKSGVQRLGPEIIITSPLSRAIQTALGLYSADASPAPKIVALEVRLEAKSGGPP